MKEQLMYKGLAKYYDLIYSKKDYHQESDYLKKLIKKYKTSKGEKLLEAACGTGQYLLFLKKDFNCKGIDTNKEMLKIAKRKNPKLTFKKANMINFKMNEKFDIILCLFSSIGYLKTYNNLKKTIRNFSLHLNHGGVLIIGPWFSKEGYKVGSVHLTVYENENIKIARADIAKARGNISVLEMEYLIAEKNKWVKHFQDKHELGMFDIQKTIEIMKHAELRSKFIKKNKKDRGLFVGVKK